MLSTGTARDAPIAHGSSTGAGHIVRRAAFHDCLFLFGIVLLSGVSYVGRLGFYSVDWYFWKIFYAAKDQSLMGLMQAFWSQHIDAHSRLVQFLYLTVGYFTFGLHPLPYHLINILVLAGAVIFFYLSLRELQLPRSVTLVVPLVYALLPHYSTDRFWIGAHQAVFSLAFFFAGFYAGLRAGRSGQANSFRLQAASIFLFALAMLSYEVILPLIPSAFLLIGYCFQREQRDNAAIRPALILRGWRYFVAAAITLGLVFLYKLQVQVRFTVPNRFHYITQNFKELVWLGMGQTIRFNGVRYGTGLPWAALTLYRSSGAGAPVAVIAGVIAISVLLYLDRALGKSRADLPGTEGAVRLIVAGFAIFALAYVPFVVFASQFTTTGLTNRLAIAAAIGPACVLVGGGALLSRAVGSVRPQAQVFGAAIAVICALNFICTASLAEYWVKAYLLEREIIADVHHNVDLPTGGTLILDGFCRHAGPAVVFEAYYDIDGALSIAYADATLHGDVVSTSLVFGDEVVTSLGEMLRYPYSDKLWLYNVERKTTYRLMDSRVAREYLQTVKPGLEGCQSDPLAPQPLVPRWSTLRLIFK